MTTTADKLAEALDNAAASLETMLAHFGAKTPPEDNANRERVLAEARAALAQHERMKPNPANMVRKVCDTCGSENVLKDAYAEWDYDAQDWGLQNVFDNEVCEDCEGECSIIDKPVTPE